MVEELVPFGSHDYYLMLAPLLFARSMDLLSTKIATPNLIHEANPIARKLGWKWGQLVNLVVCVLIACWPLPAIVMITTSLLVAARNFRSAWMMRTMGEEGYRIFMGEVMSQTSFRLYLFCLFGETALTVLVGVALIGFSPISEERDWPTLVPIGIGTGLVAYGAAVAFYTLLAVWRTRHRMR